MYSNRTVSDISRALAALDAGDDSETSVLKGGMEWNLKIIFREYHFFVVDISSQNQVFSDVSQWGMEVLCLERKANCCISILRGYIFSYC